MGAERRYRSEWKVGAAAPVVELGAAPPLAVPVPVPVVVVTVPMVVPVVVVAVVGVPWVVTL